jgi:polyene macrolide polyketide synthase
VKSNIGHTQAAAGIAGVIKMVLAMRHGLVPRSLHTDEPSHQVDWSVGAVSLLTSPVPWPESGRPRRAGVSSFGISGTNAHVILEQAPPELDVPAVDEALSITRPIARTSSKVGEPAGVAVGEDGEDAVPGLVPWVVSAKSDAALDAQVARLAAVAADPVDVAFSLATTRPVLEHRAVLLGGVEIARGRATAGPLGFLFAGQGSQRAGMGRELYEAFGVFAEAFDEVRRHLDIPDIPTIPDPACPRPTWSRRDTPNPRCSRWRWPCSGCSSRGVCGRISCWGIRSANWRLRTSRACWSLADAAKVVAARAELMQALPAGGAMVAVRAGEDDVRSHLAGGVEIAAVNTPGSVVLAGDEDAVLALAARWEHRRLRVSHAFHSAHMDAMSTRFRAVLERVEFHEPRIPVVSNLTGVEATGLTSPDYWVRQLREAVRFADGVRWLAGQDVRTFVELGPDGALTALARECVDGNGTFVPLLRRDRPEAPAILAALAHVPADWRAVVPAGRRVELPTYAFQRQRYWLEPPAGVGAGDIAWAGLDPVDHPLLGASVELADAGGVVMTGRLSLRSHPWLADHNVFGSVVVPGTALLEYALRAGAQIGCDNVEELVLETPLILPERGSATVRVTVSGQDADGRRKVAAHSRPDSGGEWARNASGTLTGTSVPQETRAPVREADVPGSLPAGRPEAVSSEWPPRGAQPVPVGDLYARAADGGFHYGPMFRGLGSIWRDGTHVFADVTLPEPEQAGRFGIHPALLDAALHPSPPPTWWAAQACRSSGAASPCTPRGPRRCACGSHRPGGTPFPSSGPIHPAGSSCRWTRWCCGQ